MKTMFEEDPSELLGLEEDEGSMELGGSEFEDEEEEPTELMGLGEEEGDEEEDISGQGGYEEEEDPTELFGMEEEDEYEDEGEESPEATQRIPGLRIAQGLRARRRARVLVVAALRKRRRARLLGISALRRRKRKIEARGGSAIHHATAAECSSESPVRRRARRP